MKDKENTTKVSTEKQVLLNKIIAYLKGEQIIETKKDLAVLLNYNDKNLTSASNGNLRYLTDSLFKKIYKKFPETEKITLQVNNAEEIITTENRVNEIKSDNDLHELVSEIKQLRKELSQQKKDNESQTKAIIDFIERERIAVSDLILDLKKSLAAKKENT